MNCRCAVAIVVVVGIFLLVPSLILASGFALYETSARGNALGGAMTARADDPSALYYNPAGIIQLPGTQFQAGTFVIAPNLQVDTKGIIGFEVAKDNGILAGRWRYVGQKPCIRGIDENSSSPEGQLFFIPNAYMTTQLDERTWFGVGTFSRFGLGIKWPENWVGRFNSYSSNVKTVEINPNFAYKLSDKVSIAAGGSLMYMDIALKSKIPGVLIPGIAYKHRKSDDDKGMLDLGMPNEIDKQMQGDSFGFGYNLGIHYQPSSLLSFGATYRSEVKHQIEGKANFYNLQGNSYGHQSSYIPSQVGVNGAITLPAQFTFGVAVKPLEKLSFEIDTYYTKWSSFDKLTFNFAKPVLNMTEHTINKNWHDTWSFRFGTEYKLTDWADLRLGYVYDQSPVPDATIDYVLPDSDRNIFNIGLGLHSGNYSCDLSASYLVSKKRHITERAMPDMVVDSDVLGETYIYGLQFGYKF